MPCLKTSFESEAPIVVTGIPMTLIQSFDGKLPHPMSLLTSIGDISLRKYMRGRRYGKPIWGTCRLVGLVSACASARPASLAGL